ncbi:MAG: hypothetical protein J6T39_00050, partial [Clostridia bacterium]|nr:hypothetical protein [Clostridia bacterium]
IAEHTHSGDEGMYVVDVPIFDKNKNLMGYEKHPIYVFTGKSMQNGNTTFAGESLFDQKTNAKGLLLSWKKNIAYSANDVTQPKYIPEPNPFNVLHKTEDKIGLRCQMLLDEYERPDITKFKEELKNKTFGEIATQVDSISSYSVQDMLNFLAAHEVDKVEDCDEEEDENVG